MEGVHAALEANYRGDTRRVRATLIRLLGRFDAAEEAVHDAFAAAAEEWPRKGVPSNPYAWLVSAGRFRTIDRRRDQARVGDGPRLRRLEALGSMYRARFRGDVSRVQMRIRTRFKASGGDVPVDVPSHRGFPLALVARLLGARVAMVLRR